MPRLIGMQRTAEIAQAESIATADAGVAALLEKREPRFNGR